MNKSLKRGLALRESKGFTLIELLVVIAIIGILASIILASLATARSKGQDASVQQEMSSMRSQAELYTGTLAAVGVTPCVTSGTNLFGTAGNGLGTILAGVITATGANSYCYSAATLPKDGGAWAVAVKLPSGSGYWCADYTGHSGAYTIGGTNYNALSATTVANPTAAFNTTTNRCN